MKQADIMAHYLNLTTSGMAMHGLLAISVMQSNWV